MRCILILTGVTFLVQNIVDGRFVGPFSQAFALSAHGLGRGALWQPFTYMFLHASFMHLFFNMLMLYVFGVEMERVLGMPRFFRLYLGCGFLAGMGWLLISRIPGGICIGASGAVYGMMGVFVAVDPDRRFMFFPFPIVLRIQTWALWMLGLSIFFTVLGTGNIAHSAHLAGGLAGYFYGRMIVRHWSFGSDHGGLTSRVHQWFSGKRAEWRRSRFRILADESGPPSRAEVDRLLEKIKTQGIGSLSPRERERLERASREGVVE